MWQIRESFQTNKKAMKDIYELNIGHAIIARAAIDGLDKAVRDMKRLMLEARS